MSSKSKPHATTTKSNRRNGPSRVDSSVETPPQPTTAAGSKIVNGLKQIHEALTSGKPIEEQLNVRYLEIDFKVGDYPPTSVQNVRQLLGVSQAVFARLLGVDVDTVQSWEQGKQTPSTMACRFMDELTRDPQYWQRRLREALISKSTGPSAPRD